MQDDNDYGQDRDERHQGEYEEEVEEEDEEAVITCLQQELKYRQNQTRVAIETIWKEVEQPGQRPRTGKKRKVRGRLQSPRRREMPRPRRGRGHGPRPRQKRRIRSPG